MFYLLYLLFHFYSASVYFGFEGKTFRPIRNIWYEDILPFTESNTTDSNTRKLILYLLLQPLKFLLHLVEAVVMLAASVLDIPIGLLLSALGLAVFLIMAPLLFIAIVMGEICFNWDTFGLTNLMLYLILGAIGPISLAIGDAFLGFTHAMLLLSRACATLIMYPFMGIYLLAKALWPSNNDPIQSCHIKTLPPNLLYEISRHLDTKSLIALSLVFNIKPNQLNPHFQKKTGFVVVENPFTDLSMLATSEKLIHNAYHRSSVTPALSLFMDETTKNPLIDSGYSIEASDYTVLFETEKNAKHFAEKLWGSSYTLLIAQEKKNPAKNLRTFWNKNQKWDITAYIDGPGIIGQRAQTFNDKHPPKDTRLKAHVVPLAYLSFFYARSPDKPYRDLDTGEILGRFEH